MKTKLSGLLIAALFGTVGMAKELHVKTNPIATIVGAPNVGIELGLTNQLAISAEGTYLNRSSSYDDDSKNKFKMSAIGAGVGVRHYLSSMHEDSLYLEGRAQYFNVSLENKNDSFLALSDDQKISVNTYTVGALFGKQWKWDSGFLLKAGIGAGYKMYTGKVNNSRHRRELGEGTTPLAEISIGFAL